MRPEGNRLLQGFLRRVENKISEAKQRAVPDGGATTAAAGEATPLQSMYTTLLSVLSGAWPVRLNLEFLYFSNATDLQLLQNMKEAFDARVSMCHSALVMANAFMHAGTTRDTFLRENLEWLKTATNWAMFGATASLGVIHHGHLGKVWPPLAVVVTTSTPLLGTYTRFCQTISCKQELLHVPSKLPSNIAVW